MIKIRKTDIQTGVKRHLRVFLAGVVVLAPLAVTLYLVWYIGSGLDGMFERFIRATAGDGAADMVPAGVGVVIILLVVYLIGLLTQWWVFRVILEGLERLMLRLPVVKTLYESVRDIMTLVGGDAKKMGQAVRYKLPGTEAYVLGIRTSTAPKIMHGAEYVAVYMPMSYQIGGFTVFVPAAAVEPLDLTVEEALKLAATASAGAPDQPPAQP